MVRAKIFRANVWKISDCNSNTPRSDWSRSTTLNLIAWHVTNEPEQVKQTSSYVYRDLQRHWFIAIGIAIDDGKVVLLD